MECVELVFSIALRLVSSVTMVSNAAVISNASIFMRMGAISSITSMTRISFTQLSL